MGNPTYTKKIVGKNDVLLLMARGYELAYDVAGGKYHLDLKGHGWIQLDEMTLVWYRVKSTTADALQAPRRLIQQSDKHNWHYVLTEEGKQEAEKLRQKSITSIK